MDNIEELEESTDTRTLKERLWTDNKFIKKPTLESFWLDAKEARKSMTKNLTSPEIEPVFNEDRAAQILEDYVEKVTPELLLFLKENKEDIEHSEPVRHLRLAWLTALLELEEQCNYGIDESRKTPDEVELQLAGVLKPRYIINAKNLFFKNHPELEYLCDECFFDRSLALNEMRTEQATLETKFKNSLPEDVKKYADEYDSIVSAEMRYWFALKKLNKLMLMQQICNLIVIDESCLYLKDRDLYLKDKDTDVITRFCSLERFASLSDIDPIFIDFPVSRRDRAKGLRSAVISYLNQAYEYLNKEIKHTEDDIFRCSHMGDRSRAEIKLYDALKAHNIVPPTGRLKALYFHFENARKID